MNTNAKDAGAERRAPSEVLVWRRAPQGGFFLEGPAIFRPRRVRIRIDGKLGIHVYPRKEAIRVVQDAIANEHTRANEYALLPAEEEFKE